MDRSSLWNYCTRDQEEAFLLSLGLLDRRDWPAKKQLACLYAVSNHVEDHYRRVELPKRSGGSRVLHIPSPLLKSIQTGLHRNVLSPMTISPHATAYRKGADLLQNASPHVGKPLVLGLDIADFFGSISFLQVYRRAFPAALFPPAAAGLLTSLCCYREYLPQGAPTSAVVSNLVMRPFDDHMARWCGERNIAYTRYCDDMTFSGDFDPGRVVGKAGGFLEAMGFELNRDKTRIMTQRRRQSVTGVVVNRNPQVNRPYRRRLRQEVHYCAQFGVRSHLERTGQPFTPEAIEAYLTSLAGKIAHVLHINPGDRRMGQAKEQVRRLRAQLQTQRQEGPD